MRDGWVEATLGQMLIIERGGSPRPIKNFLTDNPDGINWIKIGDTDKATKYISSTTEKIKPEGLKKTRLVGEGDLLLSNSMSFGRPYILKITGAIHDGWLALKAKNGFSFDTNYFYYALSSPLTFTQFDKLATGSTVRNLNTGLVSKVVIPLPPLPEQRAIVSKIEQLFSELDNGIANLKHAEKQLTIYRQAVLKKAFEGELTREWREKQTNLPTADELLEQIKEEREKYYQKQLDEWKEAVKAWENGGKEGKKPGKPKKPKELPPLSEDELKGLPQSANGWSWVKIADVSHVSGGITKNSKRNSLKLKKPLLRVANVYFNRLELSDIHQIGLKPEEVSRVSLRDNDLLIVEGNGSIDQIGRVAVWKNQVPNCVHQNHLIKARPYSQIYSEYLLHFLCSKIGRDFIIKEASSTSGLHTLSLSKVSNLKIPICSFPEQTQIVQEIESRLSVCDKLEESIKESLQKAEALRQSILKKAFAGELLTEKELQACKQEPDWEPAEVLLKRIKAEKAEPKKSPRKKTKQ